MAVSNISAYALGNLVQIDFAANVRYQLSTRVKDFDNMLKKSVGDLGGARHHEFALQTSGGPNAVQAQAADGDASAEFPDGQLSDVGFYEAVYKEVDTTIEMSLSMWNKAKAAPDKYAEPLMLESKSKALVSRREMCIYLYGDGTGKRLTIASAAITNGKLVLTADVTESAVGHTGWMQHGDLFYILPNTATITNKTPSATRLATGAATHAYYKVVARDLRLNTVSLSAYTSAGVLTTTTGIGTIVATDVIYKNGLKTAVATDSAPAGDYNTLTEVAAGFESIASNDGRTVHGITMEGATAGTISSVSGAFDPQQIQEGVTDVKTITGDEYTYNQILMAPKVKDLFVESLESDKYFRGDDPKKRGGTGFFYQHDDSSMYLVSSEFCPSNRIWAIPDGDGQEGGNPCEFRGQDFQMVNVDDNETFLAVSSSGNYRRAIQKFMNGRFCFLSKHPSSILSIRGYDAV